LKPGSEVTQGHSVKVINTGTIL